MEKTIPFISVILLLSILVSCNNQPQTNSKPTIITIHDTVYKFIPHVAPEQALLGRYERAQGPFMIPKGPGSKDSILIEDHEVEC